jgi:hypothetical protein
MIALLLLFLLGGQQATLAKPLILFPDGSALYQSLTCNAGQTVKDLRECPEYKVPARKRIHKRKPRRSCR